MAIIGTGTPEVQKTGWAMRLRNVDASVRLGTSVGWWSGIALFCFSGASPGRAQEVRARSLPIVYDDDGRLEVFEVESTLRRRIEESVVALLPGSALTASGTLAQEVRRVGESANLCADERFFEQPSAAYCSGVLIDEDLVLTAGHCVHMLPLSEISVVFGYAFESEGRLALSSGDNVRAIAETVVEVITPSSSDRQAQDFAIIRLSASAPEGTQPVPFRTRAPAPGEPLFAVGASLGVPLKVDVGATVRAVRPDVILVAADVSQGASGGPAFDRDLALVGVLASGGEDLVRTVSGCNQSRRVPSTDAKERYTPTNHALLELCEHESMQDRPLCRAGGAEGCSPSRGKSRLPSFAFLGLSAAWIWRRRAGRDLQRRGDSRS